MLDGLLLFAISVLVSLNLLRTGTPGYHHRYYTYLMVCNGADFTHTVTH